MAPIVAPIMTGQFGEEEEDKFSDGPGGLVGKTNGLKPNQILFTCWLGSRSDCSLERTGRCCLSRTIGGYWNDWHNSTWIGVSISIPVVSIIVGISIPVVVSINAIVVVVTNTT